MLDYKTRITIAVCLADQEVKPSETIL